MNKETSNRSTVSLSGYLNEIYGNAELVLNSIESLTKRLEPIMVSNLGIALAAQAKPSVKDSDLVESAKSIQDKLTEIKRNLEFLENSVQV